MHEASVAQELLGVILAYSERQGARPLRATITCGQLNAVCPDVFATAFAALAADTVCAGMSFAIDRQPFRARCSRCGAEFPVSFETAVCAACGCDRFTLLPDVPLRLETIEFEEN